MSWFYLYLAILLEVLGTTSMKLSHGFTELFPSVLMFICYGCSFICLTLALKKIDVSLTYAIWSGVGTALIALIGVFWFKEPSSPLKFFSIFLIIIGVVGLNIGNNSS